MKQILEQLLNKQDLKRDEAFNVMLSIMSGEYDDAQISGFLIALRAKGETVDEITVMHLAHSIFHQRRPLLLPVLASRWPNTGIVL